MLCYALVKDGKVLCKTQYNGTNPCLYLSKRAAKIARSNITLSYYGLGKGDRENIKI
jgi:hypothetical protein